MQVLTNVTRKENAMLVPTQTCDGIPVFRPYVVNTHTHMTYIADMMHTESGSNMWQNSM